MNRGSGSLGAGGWAGPGHPRAREVLDYLASGMTKDEILNDFPDLERDDIRACLAFAADRERRLMAVPAE